VLAHISRQIIYVQIAPLDLAQFRPVRPHTPLIKFRHSRRDSGVCIAHQQIFIISVQCPRTGRLLLIQFFFGPKVVDVKESVEYKRGSSQGEVPRVLEIWQVPVKYRRQTLSTTEMEVINAGGAGVLFS
jgi:hypothetical protein